MFQLFRNSFCLDTMYTTYWHWYVITKGILAYRNKSIRRVSRTSKTKHFCHCNNSESVRFFRLLTSYSKDKREKEATYWSFSLKVNGRSSCDCLLALYFWQNIFLHLSDWCINFVKRWRIMIGKHQEYQRTKRLLVKVSNGCFPTGLCVFVIFGDFCKH